MRVRLLDYSDKRPHSQAPEWSQTDLDDPKPQKIAETFFIETQVREDGSATLHYGGRHSTPEFPWHHVAQDGPGEYSDEEVAMTLRIWMLETFADAFPVTRDLVNDALPMLAALSIRHERARIARTAKPQGSPSGATPS